MSHKPLEIWLQEREPGIPAPFLPHLLVGREVAAGTEQLTRMGEEALLRALSHPGRNRAAAFDLLAADAHFTYACEALAAEGGLQENLVKLLLRVGETFP